MKLTKKQINNFWKKVDKLNDEQCWNWKAYIHPDGYGKFGVGADYTTTASRVSYYLHYGNFPKESLVCHTCDNRKCVNPHHLFLGSIADNMDDRWKKDRYYKKISNAILPCIKSAITVFKMTQKELAEIFNTTPSAISHALKRRA